MSRSVKNRTAVFIVRVPDNWKPQRPWSIPPCFSNGELFALNLNIMEARDFVRVFNREAIAKQQASRHGGLPWDRRFAITVPCVKIPPYWRGFEVDETETLEQVA